MKRSAAIGLVALGATLLTTAGVGVTAGQARAAADPGSLFQSLSLLATAGAQRFDADQAAGQPAGATTEMVPFTEATFVSTRAHGLASIAWPGAIGGNLGKLLVLLGPYPCVPVLNVCTPVGVPQPVQDQYGALNDPVRAEASNAGGSHTDDQSQPGVVMKVTATDSQVTAEGAVAGDQNVTVGTAGPTQASSKVALTGPQTASVAASSAVAKTTLAGGVIVIGSVTSEAHAATDGVTADASGGTQVSGMSIGGVPVTVDEKGVSVAGTSTSADAATAAVNQIIGNLGFTIFLSKPVKHVANGTVDYNAGSLTLINSHGFTIVLGGAHVAASATPLVPYTAPAFTQLGGGGTQPVTSGHGSEPGTSATSPGQVSIPGTPPVTTVSPGNPVTPTLATAGFSLGHRNPWPWAVLGLLGAGLLGFGLRRLPDHVLDAPAATCPLGEAA